MRIKFKDCDGDTHDCDHMKDLRGFRKLVVEFESLPFPGSDKPMSESERAQAVSQCQSQCEKGKIARLRKTFEPAYGPAVQGAVHSDSTYTCYLEFYPRQHLAKELMAKAGKILKEAARLSAGERAAVALLEMVETLKIL